MFYQDVWFFGLSYVLFHLLSVVLQSNACSMIMSGNVWTLQPRVSGLYLMLRSCSISWPTCSEEGLLRRRPHQTVSAGWKGPLFVKLDASEICGFILGSFESKAVAGILTGICMDDRAFFEEGPFHFAHYIVRLSR